MTSIPDALAVGRTLAVGASTSEIYYVKGEIISIENTTTGILTIKDEKGNQLYIYRTYDKTGSIKYGAMTNPPKVGATVVLCGKIMNYSGTIEMKDACFYSIE